MTKKNNKELFDFVYQFVRYGHGHVLGRLKNTRGRKCKGCVEDTNAIIETVQKQTAREILKIVEEKAIKYQKAHSEADKYTFGKGIGAIEFSKLLIKTIKKEYLGDEK